MGNKYTEAQRRATEKYKKEKITRISLDYKKEFVEEIKAAAAFNNETISGYIAQSIRDRMEAEDGRRDHVKS